MEHCPAVLRRSLDRRFADQLSEIKRLGRQDLPACAKRAMAKLTARAPAIDREITDLENTFGGRADAAPDAVFIVDPRKSLSRRPRRLSCVFRLSR